MRATHSKRSDQIKLDVPRTIFVGNLLVEPSLYGSLFIMEDFPEITKAWEQFGRAHDLRKRYLIEGADAASKLGGLFDAWKTLNSLIVQPAQRTGCGEPIPSYSPDAAKQAFQRLHPKAAPDFLKRMEQTLAAVESSKVELSEGSNSILRQLPSDIAGADFDLVCTALRKLDAIQPMLDSLKGF
jgi:hypothetical protein